MLEKNILEKYNFEGLSTRKIAEKMNCGQTTVRYWLNKYGISTNPKLPLPRQQQQISLQCLNCESNYEGYKGRKFCSLKCQFEYKHKLKVKDIENNELVGKRVLKKYLIAILGYKCQNSNCGWDWSKPSTVEIEHLDGNPKNNKLYNVTLLCPNCHSQTDTYKSKNSKKYKNKKEKLCTGEAPH